MNNNYVILVDENGQPFIAHGLFGDLKRKGAKYIEKITEGAKTRYFYTQQEIEAYRNKQRELRNMINSKNQSARAYQKLAGQVERQARRTERADNKRTDNAFQNRKDAYQHWMSVVDAGKQPGLRIAQDYNEAYAKNEYEKANREWINSRIDKNYNANSNSRLQAYYDKLIEDTKNSKVALLQEYSENTRTLIRHLIAGPPSQIKINTLPGIVAMKFVDTPNIGPKAADGSKSSQKDTSKAREHRSEQGKKWRATP